nr:unnamed protein product [Callosobruchus chinensis]
MDNCPAAQPRIACKRENLDTDCKKVNAPYKSYSELCAQRLPDDPSECMQCPWQRCGGVDDIKPPSRKYHTATLAQTMGSSQWARAHQDWLLPQWRNVLFSDQSRFGLVSDDYRERAAPGLFYDCDAKKKEECPEVKRRCPNPCGIENTAYNKKKCSDWNAAFRLWSDKNILDDKDWLDMQKMAKEYKGPEEIAINYEMKKCPQEKDKCPKKKRHRIEVDTSIDERFKPLDPCCKKEKHVTRRTRAGRNAKICKDKGKKKERWDKGNPPPCPEKPMKPDQNCPKEEQKLPYRKERDFKKPYYKRPDEPYSEFHDY